jgi:hypothetical protein
LDKQYVHKLDSSYCLQPRICGKDALSKLYRMTAPPAGVHCTHFSQLDARLCDIGFKQKGLLSSSAKMTYILWFKPSRLGTYKSETYKLEMSYDYGKRKLPPLVARVGLLAVEHPHDMTAFVTNKKTNSMLPSQLHRPPSMAKFTEMQPSPTHKSDKNVPSSLTHMEIRPSIDVVPKWRSPAYKSQIKDTASLSKMDHPSMHERFSTLPASEDYPEKECLKQKKQPVHLPKSGVFLNSNYPADAEQSEEDQFYDASLKSDSFKSARSLDLSAYESQDSLSPSGRLGFRQASAQTEELKLRQARPRQRRLNSVKRQPKLRSPDPAEPLPRLTS